jgi:phasin family protein
VSTLNEQFTNALKITFPVNAEFANAAKSMFPNNEEFANSARTHLATHLSALTALATNACENMERVMDLNLNFAKASMEDSAVRARQLLSAKDPQEFLSLTVAQAQPTAAKAIAYSRHMAGLAAAAKADFTRVAEEQIAETSRTVSAMLDKAYKGAPAGSENAIAIMKSAIGNASAGYAQFTTNTQQVADVLAANLHSAVDQVSQSTEQTISSRGRPRKQ